MVPDEALPLGVVLCSRCLKEPVTELVWVGVRASSSHRPHNRSHQLTVLFCSLTQVLAQRKEDEGSGVIVNTMGWVDGEGYRLLVHAAKALGVNVVLVLGQDRLHSELDRDLGGSGGVDVVKLAKSGGVVTRQREFRKVGACIFIPSSYWLLLRTLRTLAAALLMLPRLPRLCVAGHDGAGMPRQTWGRGDGETRGW